MEVSENKESGACNEEENPNCQCHMAVLHWFWAVFLLLRAPIKCENTVIVKMGQKVFIYCE